MTPVQIEQTTVTTEITVLGGAPVNVQIMPFGARLPRGGMPGDVLTKTSAHDFVAGWRAPPASPDPITISDDAGQLLELREDGLFVPGNLLSTNW